MPDIRFYDTCSLLLAGESIFETDELFIISSITLKELENIKTSSNKDIDIKYNARLLLHLLNQYKEKYKVIIHSKSYEKYIINKDIEISNDTKILSDAVYCNNFLYPDEIIFVTNDLSLKNIANLFFGDGMLESVPEEVDTYTGWHEVSCEDEELAKFYENPECNFFNLVTNQYLVLKNIKQEIVDVQVWDGFRHRNLKYKEFKSDYLGKIKPYNNDIYQRMAFDSLLTNQITMLKGGPGTGKTLLSLGYLMYKLERHDIDRIVIFCNTVATMNSAKLGFYPGSRTEKLLDSQIGNLLISKFGGREAIEQLMSQNKLYLIPACDCRGFDTTGMQAGIYISEAQNLDRELMKLLLTRVGEDSICIIDGDERTQVDDIHFAGNNNGMRRASKIFRGHDFYGEVSLINVHRSQIAKLAQFI